ncbi:hypothetical protein MPH_02251 [Macrophomina phaseolina MS6]|uniref:Uncharacterized protein n=1 Tax=Macrophomina phaseolina (strain MS6) TaxID=1126212 RepID=K2RD33_MACPH|nr:hypothetical protein MPH_02251 [Macrophomina phaseolina MS6]
MNSSNGSSNKATLSRSTSIRHNVVNHTIQSRSECSQITPYPDQDNELLFESLTPTLFRIRKIRLLRWQTIKFPFRQFLQRANLFRICIDYELANSLSAAGHRYARFDEDDSRNNHQRQ